MHRWTLGGILESSGALLLGNEMDELLARLRQFRDDRDWSRFHTPKDLAISVSVESAELLELFQWRPTDEPLTEEMITSVGGEAADVLLYLVLLCDSAGIDLIQAAHAKITRNEQRFPVHTSHGVAKPDDQESAS